MTSFDLFLLRKKRERLKKDKQIHIDKIKKITEELAEIEEKIRIEENEHGFKTPKRI